MEELVLLNVNQVAERLGISSRQCWKLLCAGRFPKPVRLGRSVRWRQDVITKFIERGCVVERHEDPTNGRAHSKSDE